MNTHQISVNVEPSLSESLKINQQFYDDSWNDLRYWKVQKETGEELLRNDGDGTESGGSGDYELGIRIT